MNLRTLTILMWKHALVRKRKYIHTTVEILVPLVFFAMLFWVMGWLSPAPTKSHDSFVANTEVVPLTNETPIPNVEAVLYYPDTPLASMLMDEVGKKLQLNRLKELPELVSGKTIEGYFSLKSEDQLTHFTSNMQPRDTVVLFQNMYGATLPDTLNYTIRMKNDFHTESYQPKDNQPGPHAMYGIDYFTFMRLQWAIDSSYLKVQTGSDVVQRVSLQEFPYFRTLRNDTVALICALLGAVCWLSLLLTFVFHMARLVDERASGIQELIKMTGVSMPTLGLSHYLNALPGGLVFSIGGTIFLKSTTSPLITNTGPGMIFLALLLHYNSVIALAFASSYILRSAEYVVTMAVILYTCAWFPGRILFAYELPDVVSVLSGLIPLVPIRWFWSEVSVLELYGKASTIDNMYDRHTLQSEPVFYAYLFSVIQTIIFYILTWYLSNVRPGKYGQALPWNFICTRFWPKKVEPHEDSDGVQLVNRENQYFETLPSHMRVGIRIENVSKLYSRNRVLKDVSLNVYHGEITVLLGHNGAGKTTLMSIITGMTSATSGKVYVNDLDTVNQQDKVRQQIGLCPQHNMFFTDLTLGEHIMFFTLLKRGTYREARDSSQKLAAQLGLDNKLNDKCALLSGGMKRRAQLACALAGDADVLVLDEPTAGLDVETRRELWDLLLGLRGARTVLLTTHIMEEADALGDRVAALHAGVLRCFATTMHLKKAIGTGYRLTLTTSGIPKTDEITRKVVNHVPDATLRESTYNSISFNLPAAAHNKFPSLFSALESAKSELGVENIGVGVSTLEEVFLKLCSDVDTSVEEMEEEATAPEPIRTRLTGVPLYLRQFIVLLKRQISYAFYRKWVFLIMQVLIPVFVLVQIVIITNNEFDDNASQRRSIGLDLNIYSNEYGKRVLYDLDKDDDVTFRAMTGKYRNVAVKKTHDIANAILEICKKDELEYNKYIAGIQLNDTDATVLYTTTVRHAAPVALNLLSNLLVNRSMRGPTRRIITINNPVQGYIRGDSKKTEPKTTDNAMLYNLLTILVVATTTLHCVSLPSKERETGSRQIHIITGCPPELYWGTTLLYHMILAVLFLVLPTIIGAVSFEADSTINRSDFLQSFSVILLLGCLTMYAFMYLVSQNHGARSTNLILTAILILFGIICPIMKVGYDFFEKPNQKRSIWSYAVDIASYLVPPFTMMTASMDAIQMGRVNTWCDLLKDKCPSFFVPDALWDAATLARCCAGKQARCYFCIEQFAPGRHMIALCGQFVFFMTWIFLSERGVTSLILEKLKAYKAKPFTDIDQMVREEEAYVEKEISKSPNEIKNDALLAHDLHKKYMPITSKSVDAVKGVSLSVKKGECFGLLGVNGAGKSTMFKMLTAEECATRGNVFGNGYHLGKNRAKYLQTLGYCPQFFGLDFFLTGQQNLALVLTLSGYNANHVKELTNTWIGIVGLEKYASRLVEAYSGGCMRRLGTAAALCSGAALTLLDEPTAGVDPAARRRLWAAARRALAHHRSIVITSHSMDEMEALCHRIAIMSQGRLRALGSPPALRAAFASGHAVVFKLKHSPAGDETDGPTGKLNTFKGKLREKFDCTLKDEHKTMLNYHINQTMHYSDLFNILEKFRTDFPDLVEDYSVSETTLEEVFLSFAREAAREETAVP